MHLSTRIILSLFNLLLLQDQIMSLLKFNSNFFIGSHLSRHPRMRNNIDQIKSHIRCELKHICNKIFKICRKEICWLIARVLIPEQICAISNEQLVVGVVNVGLFEWGVPRIQNEEDDTECEEVSLVALVSFLANEFGTHVGDCAECGFEVTAACAALEWGSETEVSDLEVVFMVKHHILWLQVTVSEAFRVCMVYSLEHLLEESSANMLVE